MFWWIIALVIFFGWAAGLDVGGMIILCVIIIILTLISVGSIDRRRHKKAQKATPPDRYHPK
jgi:hypothetical protein